MRSGILVSLAEAFFASASASCIRDVQACICADKSFCSGARTYATLRGMLIGIFRYFGGLFLRGLGRQEGGDLGGSEDG